MEKYGFVYIWFDRKRKMFYIGCHWGLIEDGYICSSNRMRDAYRRRPSDFKRKILVSNIDTREATLEEESRWFSLIKEQELGVRYYNLRKHKWGHWVTDESSKLSVGQKISASRTGKKYGNRKPRTEIEKIKISKGTSKGMKKYFELNGVRTGEKNNQYGTCWVTNGKENKKIKKKEIDIWLVKGYYKGRLLGKYKEKLNE